MNFTADDRPCGTGRDSFYSSVPHARAGEFAFQNQGQRAHGGSRALDQFGGSGSGTDLRAAGRDGKGSPDGRGSMREGVWAGKGGYMPQTASVPTVSEPQPIAPLR